MILNEIMKKNIFQHNSNFLLRWTFSLTPEEAMVDDLEKACVTERIIVLFIENPDLVSNIYISIFTLQESKNSCTFRMDVCSSLILFKITNHAQFIRKITSLQNSLNYRKNI